MDVSVQFLILVPVVVGIVQAVKTFGMASKYAPLLSVLLGVAGAMTLIGGFDGPSALQGFIAGLTAAGLWSGAKASFFS